MNNIIHKLLNVLKDQVNRNNKEIEFNQQEIDKLLSEISVTTRKKDLDSKYSLNRQLLNENADFVKMQLELSDFLEKYDYLFPDEPEVTAREEKNIDEQSLFKQTVSGQLTYDVNHPQFNNPRFFKELLRYYEMNEDYEMCDKLLKYRKL